MVLCDSLLSKCAHHIVVCINILYRVLRAYVLSHIKIKKNVKQKMHKYRPHQSAR